MTYSTLSGHTIELGELAADVTGFLDRLKLMLVSPRVTEQEMIGLAYSKENPILDHSLFAERGAVTRDVLGNPVYHVIMDILARKRVAVERIDLERVAAEYTLTVPEAATRLDIHESAVRQAIAAKRLPAWVKDGRYYLAPRSVDSFDVGTRGPQSKKKKASASVLAARRREANTAVGALVGFLAGAKASLDPDVLDNARDRLALEVRMGHQKDAAFRVKHVGELAERARVGANIVTGKVPRWERVAVLTGGKDGQRLFVLVPDKEPNELKWGPFYVRGPFKIVEKVNNPQMAQAIWKTFGAA